MIRFGIVVIGILVSFGCASQKTGNDPGATHRPKPETKKLTHLVASKNPEAQALFERGIVLTYGFNHAEAHKTFENAVRLDRQCALCYWGAALVLGPNINTPMSKKDASKAYKISQRAHELSKEADPKIRVLTEALTHRYGPEALDDRSPLDEAYAEAMRQAALQFPDDAFVQVLLAEALMDLHPWDYWTDDGLPRSWTPEILNTLDTALKLDPDNANANHLHIHAVEASPHPERAEASADRLRALAPDSGHLLHMPAHIYMRIGRYADAAEVNTLAIDNDEAYRAEAKPEGVYPLAYMPHNRHFLWIASANTGQSKRAIQAAFGMAGVVDTKKMADPGFGTLQHYWVMPLYALIRFGKWEDILKQSQPQDNLLYPRGVWHYARGRALNGLGKFPEAEKELDALQKIASDPALEKVTLWGINKTADLLQVAAHVLAGEIAHGKAEPDAAVEHLMDAVSAEDQLRYDEPPAWYYPARQNLGAILLDAGLAKEAEQVFRKDLERHRNNGWSLFGLWQSLEAQGKNAEAEEAQSRFQQTWKHADITLKQARF